MKLFSKVLGKLLRRGAFNGIHSPEEFRLILERERARADRSGSKFSLVVFDFGNTNDGKGSSLVVEHLTRILFRRIRLTDTVGWFDDKSIGTVLPGTSGQGAWKFADDVRKKASAIASHYTYRVYTYPMEGTADEKGVSDLPRRQEVSRQYDQVSFEGFFIKTPAPSSGYISTLPLKSAVPFRSPQKPVENAEALFARPMPLWKRGLDLLGATVGLILVSPLMLAVSIAIKLTSQGPIIFKQERLGFLRKKFTFLKFRSMYVNQDSDIHKNYTKNFIKNGVLKKEHGEQDDCYKIKNDPRVTPVGKFLRKTSIDELPQLINVLKGEMTLIGPRPPLPYEYENYDIWHKRRILETVPGITGLWQVKGRSSTTFNEMVRLDLKYIKKRSLWLDIKILFQTFWAVLSRKGAY
jgi:lipopolysaccharide/colanic/teichoic acid biosynthesis glycosyltransferase